MTDTTDTVQVTGKAIHNVIGDFWFDEPDFDEAGGRTMRRVQVPKAVVRIIVSAAIAVHEERHRLSRSPDVQGGEGFMDALRHVCSVHGSVEVSLAGEGFVWRQPFRRGEESWQALRQSAADPVPDRSQEVVEAAGRLSRFCKEWRVRMARKQSCEEIYAVHMGDPREAVCDVRDVEVLIDAALQAANSKEVK